MFYQGKCIKIMKMVLVFAQDGKREEISTTLKLYPFSKLIYGVDYREIFFFSLFGSQSMIYETCQQIEFHL